LRPREINYLPHKVFGNQKNAGTYFLALLLSDQIIIKLLSIFWVAWMHRLVWQACASGSNRCNTRAWIHRAWRELDMSFRTLRRWHRASLWGRC